MEKIYSIKQTHKANQHNVRKGFYIEVECCMCNHEAMFAGDTEKEALTAMTDAGWRDIESDQYGVQGWHCGCDYKD